jgi:hypothetical protein
VADALVVAEHHALEHARDDLLGPVLRHSVGVLVEELEQIPAALLRDDVQLRLRVDHLRHGHDVGVLQQLEVVDLGGHAHQRGERGDAVLVDDLEGIFFVFVFQVAVLDRGELPLSERRADTVLSDLILCLGECLGVLLVGNHSQVGMKFSAMSPQDIDCRALLLIVALSQQHELVKQRLLLLVKRLYRHERLRCGIFRFFMFPFLSGEPSLKHLLRFAR